MNIQYDKVTGAAYFRLSEETVARTVPVTDRLIADLDAQGNTVGLELLDIASNGHMAALLEENAMSGVPVIIN